MRRNLPRGHGGPLMTDHLQLHDLDLELELLKRKREMIEKQQQHIMGGPFNRPRPFDYGNQPQSFQGLQPPFKAGPAFSRYDDPPQASGFGGGGGLLGKRPINDQPWQSHSTPKRFSGPQGGPKRKFGPSPKANMPRPVPLIPGPQIPNRPFSQNRPVWNKPQPFKGPKSNFPSQRFNNPKSNRPPNKDFKPTKVTKPKGAGPPNKLANLPASERAKFVKQATKSQNQPKTEEVDPNFILREDQVPTQQLAGRLELALGNILKEIKTKYGNSEPHTVSFQSMFLQRQMKQAIRERLRSVMMGKYVGKAVSIVEAYRKVFPVETDSEIVQIAFDAQQSAEAKKLAIKLESAGNAYKYIKHNINRLVGVTLDEMFEKLQNMYENGEESTRDICSKIISEEVPDTGKSSETREGTDADKNGSNVENDDEAKNGVQESNDVEIEENGQNNDTKEVDDKDENVNEPSEATGDLNEGDITSNVENKAENVGKPKNDEAAAKLDSLVLSLIRRRLPYILPRYKNVLLKILNVSGAYQVTKDAILEKAQEKQRIDRRVEEAEQSFQQNGSNETNSITSNTSTPSRPMVSSPYMVKILGRPVLPKRKLMQDFLNDYAPTSVKKHRSMHLLFIAFDKKENFDRLVAVKETTLGNSTIFIKVNERFSTKPDESLNATATLDDSTESATIPSELDDQISDLLSSIRNDQDIKDDDVNSATAAQNGDDGKTAPAAQNGVAKEAETKLNGGTVNSNEKEETVATEEKKDSASAELKSEANDKVVELKNEAKESGRATPTRASSRLANVTPSSVRTRRASRLTNN